MEGSGVLGKREAIWEDAENFFAASNMTLLSEVIITAKDAGRDEFEVLVSQRTTS